MQLKILILCDGDEYSLGWSYKRGFEAAGCQVDIIDPGVLLNMNPLWRNRISRRLLERQLIEAFNRHWLPRLLEREPPNAIWVGKGAWATPWLWDSYKARRPDTKLVCYNADDPITTYSRGGNRPWVTESIPYFDLFCTYNANLIEPLRRAGAKDVLRLPFAWDPAIHPMQGADAYEHDLVFVGNGDAYREEWLTEILRYPEARNWRVAIYGKWHKVADRMLAARINSRQVMGAEMAGVLARSKLAINILRRQNEGSHNMRTFETPGCGGLMTSQFSDEQNAIFPDAEAAVYFTTPEEACARLEEAIRDDERREIMRKEARAIVRKHTYRERAANLLEHL